MFNANNSVRLFLFNLAIINIIAIGLSGFAAVHWFSYVLPGFLMIAAITGFCPGLLVSKKVLAMLGINE